VLESAHPHPEPAAVERSRSGHQHGLIELGVEAGFRIYLEVPRRPAAHEIGRQLCLRGIGGLIVIDFIHLNEPDNIQKVLEVLAASLAKDRTPTQISPMSEFGLVEITRKRIRDPLFKLMTECCRPCHGHGRTRTAESVAFEVLRRVERQAVAAPGKPILVRAAPEIVRWLEIHGDEIRSGLARRGAARVQFETRGEFTREGFDVGTLP